MKRMVCCLVLNCMLLALWSCGDVDDGDMPDESAEDSIVNVLTLRWQRGYMTEDLDLYASAYWEEGFEYHGDMGTPADPGDDLIVDDLREELELAGVVFARYQDLEIEVSEPEITIVSDTEAAVRQHYRISGHVADGASLEGGYVGWVAEGDSDFTFEQRADAQGNTEWRIVRWLDSALPPNALQ